MARTPILLSLLFVAAIAGPVAADSSTPLEWLERMSRAVQTLSYEGTVVRIDKGGAAAFCRQSSHTSSA